MKAAVSRVNLVPGAMMLVQIEEGADELPLADAAVGLIEPDAGRVEFLGEIWPGMNASRQALMRGRIGRVFEHAGWVSNLDILENVCLAECHHTHRPLREIVEEAEGLARFFGVDGIPPGRPAFASNTTLRRLEWVRALLGRPALLILERPAHGMPKDCVYRLIDAVVRAAEQRAAVLWTTCETRDWEHTALQKAARFVMQGAAMVPFGERRDEPTV